MIVRILDSTFCELLERYEKDDDEKDDVGVLINRALRHVDELMGLTKDPWPELTGHEFNDEEICDRAVKLYEEIG